MAPLGPCRLLRCAPRFPRRSGPTPGLPPRRGRSGALAPAEPAGPREAAPARRPAAGGQSRGGKRRRGPAHLERSRPGTQPRSHRRDPTARRDPRAASLPARLPAAAAASTDSSAGQRKAVSELRPGCGGLGVALPSGSICSRRRAPALPEPLRAELGRAVTKEAAVRGGWVSSPSHCSCIAP